MPLPDLAAEAALDRLYARLPTIDCKGLCAESCGPIGATAVETARIARRGVDLPGARAGMIAVIEGRDPGPCPALTADGRCSVYRYRPLICRAWGLTRSMACPHGCVPSRWLNDDEVHALLAEAARIGGGDA